MPVNYSKYSNARMNVGRLLLQTIYRAISICKRYLGVEHNSETHTLIDHTSPFTNKKGNTDRRFLKQIASIGICRIIYQIMFML